MERKVITYGTFDMFHIGHLNILKRAKDYGNYLIVGVTSEHYDRSRGKLNVVQGIEERIEAVKKLSFVDEVIVESHQHQKKDDIKKYSIDTFVIGDDWVGKFDYLKEYCEVIYLPRTKGISSTILRKDFESIKIGLFGAGRIANRFVKEALAVPGIEIKSVMSNDLTNVENFIYNNSILYGFNDEKKFLESDIDAVYIATPHDSHYKYCKMSLLSGKHVLCEKPATLNVKELEELIELAYEKNLVFMEAIKTSYLPAFNKLLEELNTGIIGEIKGIRATFTKLVDNTELREWQAPFGGATNELASYPLMLATKILGEVTDINFYDQICNNVDSSNTIVCRHKNNGVSVSTVALGMKSEGDAVISGTKGYIYIPAPWWLTKEFIVKFEDTNKEFDFNYKFEGDGLRYEISEFIACIKRNKLQSDMFLHKDINEINKVISRYNEGRKQ